MLDVGDSVRGRLEFTDDEGRRYDASALSRYRGLAIYFYPMDFTRVCTEEACAFRDVYGEILRLGGAVFGVSLDSDAKHRAFRKQYHIPFPLICDRTKDLSRLFGALRLGGLLRNKRVTFVIDQEGIIRARIHNERNGLVHVDAILRFLRENETSSDRTVL